MGDKKQYPELGRTRLTAGWWKVNRHYTMYMVREWTSLFVALYSLIFIYGLSLWWLGSSADFLNFLKNPAVIGFGIVLPVMIYMTAIAYPFRLWPFNGTRDPSFLVTGHLLGALFVFVTIAGSLYHGIFRFQSTLTEVGLLKYRRTLEAVGYLIIFAGIIILGYILLSWYAAGKIM